MTFLKHIFVLLKLMFLVSVVLELYFVTTSRNSPRIVSRENASVNKSLENGLRGRKHGFRVSNAVDFQKFGSNQGILSRFRVSNAVDFQKFGSNALKTSIRNQGIRSRERISVNRSDETNYENRKLGFHNSREPGFHNLQKFDSEETRMERQENNNENRKHGTDDLRNSDSREKRFRDLQNLDSNESRMELQGKTTLSAEELYFKPRRQDVNHVNFTFLINHPKLCEEKQPFVLFLIQSTAKNAKLRSTIRNSWVGSIRSGHWNESHKISEHVVYLFLLGNSPIDAEIQTENDKFRDIVLMSFEESYRNTIYKSYMGLRWFREFCRQALFVVKVDEDVFVHVPNLISYLRGKSRSLEINETIFGRISSNNHVYRSPKYFKWTVSYEEYPLPQFPLHASGGIYFMAGPVAMAIINMADFLPLVHIEDAFFCGILRHALGFRVEAPEIHLSRRHIRALCWFQARRDSLLALHPVGEYNMRLIKARLPFLNETSCNENERERLNDIYPNE